MPMSRIFAISLFPLLVDVSSKLPMSRIFVISLLALLLFFALTFVSLLDPERSNVPETESTSLFLFPPP